MARRNQGPRLRWLEKRKAYYIVWTERGRSRERSTGTADRERAEAAFGEWLRSRGRQGPRDPNEILVTEVLNDYARERGAQVVAPRVIGCAIEPLTAFWEGYTVAEVTTDTCSQYAAQRVRVVTDKETGRSEKRPCSRNTVRRELAVLRAAINRAHRCGRLTRQAAVDLPEKPEPRDRWLTRKETAALLRASKTAKARPYLPLFILLGLYTGRRKEAILSLRWHQVDLEAGRIDFEVAGRRRTSKRRGKVPIPPRLLPHLRRARQRGTELGYVLHINGAPIGDIKKGFAAACERAGVEGVTPHVLKHTAITWAMQNGVDLWQASGYFATSIKTLIDVYGHHHPNHLREAAKAIGSRPHNVRVIA